MNYSLRSNLGFVYSNAVHYYRYLHYSIKHKHTHTLAQFEYIYIISLRPSDNFTSNSTLIIQIHKILFLMLRLDELTRKPQWYITEFWTLTKCSFLISGQMSQASSGIPAVINFSSTFITDQYSGYWDRTWSGSWVLFVGRLFSSLEQLNMFFMYISV